MQKKIVSLTLALLMVLSLSVSALAATPRWVNTNSCNVVLTFSGTTAECGVIVVGKPGVNKIVAMVTLEKLNSNGFYSLVDNWSQTANSGKYILDGTSAGCIKGTTYRLTVTATVYKGGVGETVSNYITGVC